MFKLHSTYGITLAQKKVADQIVDRFSQDIRRQVLLGVTGAGKTFIMAHILKELNIPALILSPNKILAAQLYQEFKGFFPENHVGYFISYYDYYQPEAFVPHKNLFIAKEVSINPELERLRLEAVRSLLESPFTVIVASVSSIYSIGSPEDFSRQKITYRVQDLINREKTINDWVSLGYIRTEGIIETGRFRLRGDNLEIFPTSEENPLRFTLKKGKLSKISSFDAITAATLSTSKQVNLFPINYFYYHQNHISWVIDQIKEELQIRMNHFLQKNKREYAERLQERTLFDIELLEQYGHCPGIENYSLYLTRRKPGQPPYTLLDFFGGDFLTVIDESHIALPQLKGMYAGDRSRKETLVEYGFRLPSALDNRPLNFAEIMVRLKKVLYVSATPDEFEIKDSAGQVSELLVRPTGLIDPEIIIRKSDSPVTDMFSEISAEIKNKNRILITTLTKRMAEKLSHFLTDEGIKCTYMHAEVKPLDRIKIIQKLRQGDIDVLIGINLLREGLDLPEVALVIVLDADREGFLRSRTSLIQIFGRAARHVKGRVILYIQEMTASLTGAIEESKRRRNFQVKYNLDNHIIPASITKEVKRFYDDDYWIQKSQISVKEEFKDKEALLKEIDRLTREMKIKAQDLDFKSAAILRDHIKSLKNMLLEFY